jgi:ABC-2 type transport system ATP-binding protein
MSVIQINHLVKEFGEVRAVDDLSFEVGEGTVTGFLGPNGSGKSTTLRALLGLVTPDSGTATIHGRPYAALTDPLNEVGAMLEAAAHPARTARGQLRVVAAEAGVPRSRVDEVLRLVELDSAADRRAGGFSLGMRQRLGIAGALVADPRVLVLDEPANGLDPEGIRWMRDFLRGLAAEGRTVLLSSHVLSEVAQTVDDVVVISAGRLVAHQSLEQITHGGGARLRVRSIDDAKLAAALRGAGLDVTVADDALSVAGADREAVAEMAFAAGVVVYDIADQASSLEDAFLSLTSTEAEEVLS